MRAMVFCLFVILLFPVTSGATGYAGQQDRDIASLSADETADLLAGRGMGLAKAGELNHYPGPRHVLDLGDELALTAGQRTAIEASFAQMSAAARKLGNRIVMGERTLDEGFRQGTMTPAELTRITAGIAAVYGELRAVHLAAHLEMRAILTPLQIAIYDRLRGYEGGTRETPSSPHDMHHAG